MYKTISCPLKNVCLIKSIRKHIIISLLQTFKTFYPVQCLCVFLCQCVMLLPYFYHFFEADNNDNDSWSNSVVNLKIVILIHHNYQSAEHCPTAFDLPRSSWQLTNLSTLKKLMPRWADYHSVLDYGESRHSNDRWLLCSGSFATMWLCTKPVDTRMRGLRSSLYITAELVMGPLSHKHCPDTCIQLSPARLLT